MRRSRIALALMSSVLFAAGGCNRSIDEPPEPAEPGDHADGIGESGAFIPAPRDAATLAEPTRTA